MTYFEGFVVPVPTTKREDYRRHAEGAAPLLREFGVQRQLEAWADDVPDGKLTDFRKSVQADDGETVVFAFLEYPDKATRDAANAKMISDPRAEALGKDVPFDGKRMIYGGFEPLLDEGSPEGGYTDGFVVPVPEGNRDAYRALAQKSAGIFREYGATRVVEAWEDDVPDGKQTDFRRAVKGEAGEKVVFSFIEWPDKATRDEAWKKIMEDERMKPDGEMPFSGQRMFWGGFDPVVDTAKQAPAHA